MWRHLKNDKRPANQAKIAQKKRFDTVIVLIAGHAFFDILGLVGFAVAKLSPDLGITERFCINIVASTVSSFHVAFYPIVYCGVRDLKFHDQVKLVLKAAKSGTLHKGKETEHESKVLSTTTRVPTE